MDELTTPHLPDPPAGVEEQVGRLGEGGEGNVKLARARVPCNACFETRQHAAKMKVFSGRRAKKK